jgi:hypothetical protein
MKTNKRLSARQETVLLSRSIAKPCPFCMALADIRAWHDPGSRLVACSNDECHVAPSAYGRTRKQALTRWNQRGSCQ